MDKTTFILDLAATASVALSVWLSLKKRDRYANFALLLAAILYLFIAARLRLYASALLCGVFLIGAISGVLNITTTEGEN